MSKDTKRRMKGKNIELILQNVWNRQTLTEEYKENFLQHAAQCRFQYEKFRSFLTCAELYFYGFFFFNERHCLRTFFSCTLNIPSGLYTTEKSAVYCVVFHLLEQRETHHWCLKSLQKS